MSGETTETYEPDAECLSVCLSVLRRKSTELAVVVERWDGLPEAVKGGILAMVRASDGS